MHYNNYMILKKSFWGKMLRTVLEEMIDWIFPEKCIICNCEISKNSLFCSQCFSDLKFIEFPICQCCGKQMEISIDNAQLCETCLKFKREFEFCRSLLIYDKVSRRLIIKIKRKGDHATAKRICQLLAFKYQNLFSDADLIVPVPSHWTRLLKRGYNPPAIIASKISHFLKIPFRTDVLKRVLKTQYQKNKSFEERLENVNGAFLCKKDLSGKKIILVDDVLTTGATLNECAKTLKSANAEKVFGLTIASTAIL